jgi:hypothetical protein
VYQAEILQDEFIFSDHQRECYEFQWRHLRVADWTAPTRDGLRSCRYFMRYVAWACQTQGVAAKIHEQVHGETSHYRVEFECAEKEIKVVLC